MQKYGVFFCEIFTKNTIVFTNCRKIAWAIFYAKIHTATFLIVKLLKGSNHGICHQFFPNSYAFHRFLQQLRCVPLFSRTSISE